MNKILRIITRLNVGGPSKHVSWLSNGLNQRGWKNIIICGKVEENEDDMSDFFNQFDLQKIEVSSLKRSISLKDDFKTILKIYKTLKKEKPLIVDTHMSKAALVGRVAVKLYNLTHKQKIKTVHTFHGHTFRGYFSPAKEKLFLNIEKFLAKYATDKIITISKQQQNEILGIYGVGSKEQHEIINLGIDTSFSDELDKKSFREDFGIPLEAKVFGIVGRIAEIKNHKLFIDSVKEFNTKIKDNIFFVIIGDGDKDYVNELKKYANGIDNVIFAGNQMDPKYFYGALDFLVLTSKNEGTPVSILEAFACRIPVISTAVGGVVDLIGKNERGIIAKEDCKDLAKKYKYALENNLEDIVTNAKKFVEKNYSIENLVDKTDKLYRQLI